LSIEREIAESHVTQIAEAAADLSQQQFHRFVEYSLEP
jgi:hypothetical protein